MGARALLDQLIAAGEDHQKAPQRALRTPSLRPYLPGRAHVRRTVGGLPVLVRMAWKAARTGLRKATAPPKTKKQEADKPAAAKDGEKKKDEPGFLDALERAGAAVLIVIIGLAAGAGAAGTLWAQVAPYARTVIGVAVVALLTAAWAVGPTTPPKKTTDTPPSDPTQTSPADLIARDRAAMLTLLDEATRGRNGIHLDPLHQITSAHPLFAGVARPQLGALLAGLDVPVVRSLSVDGVEGRTGVRRTAVEQLLTDRSPDRDQATSRTPESASDQQISRPLLGDSRGPLGTALGPP